MLVLGFHRIEPPTGLEITRLSPVRFDRLLAMIAALGPEVDNPAETSRGAHCILLTFDDGFLSVAKTALPALAQRGWPALVFLIAGSVGKTDDWDVSLLGPKRTLMSWNDAKQWSGRGIEFGSHTVTHADLTALSDRALNRELKDSRIMIEDQLSQAVRYLAYPYGRHDDRVRAAAEQAGYQAAFAAGFGLKGDPFAIPRAMIHGLTSLREFRTILKQAVPEGDHEQGHRGAWRSRFFQTMNAGSAPVANWRRTRRNRSRSLGNKWTDGAIS